MSGSINIVNAKAAEKAEKWANGCTKIVYANKPIAMLGKPERTSARKRTNSAPSPRP